MIEQPLLLSFLFIIGTAIGSFLGVLADRLPQEQTILGRSHCDYCKKNLKPQDLIPILSFIYYRGRTRCCGKKLSVYYPMIEIVTGTFFILTWIFLGTSPEEKIAYLGIVSTLIVIFFADAKYQIIPDSMQVLLFLFTLFLKFLGGIFSLILTVYALGEGIIVMLPILLLFLLTKGRGMGFGDVKLAFVMGFLLGWQGGLIALYIGFIVGAAVGIYFIAVRHKKFKSKIAFGPFLVIGTLAILFFQDPILSFFSKLYGL